MSFSFSPLLEQLTDHSPALVVEPSYQEYCVRHGFAPGRAPTRISVDHYTSLPKELHEAHAMVLRLGGPASRAGFALVRVQNQLRSFFLFDDDAFAGAPAEVFLSQARFDQLMPFFVTQAKSEKGLVNLAIASGALSRALRLDNQAPLSAPAHAQSTFTFGSVAHEQLPEPRQEDYKGQVEIDAVLCAQREGRAALFVLEAKRDGSDRSLAKHKIAYAIWGLRSRLKTPALDVIGVYLKVGSREDGIHFRIAEYRLPDKGECLASLERSAAPSHLVLPHLHI